MTQFDQRNQSVTTQYNAARDINIYYLHGISHVPAEGQKPFMVADLPPYFVPRVQELEQLVDAVLHKLPGESAAITAALRGAGGYGKTTIAMALCHDPRIKNHFTDGILWVTLGEHPANLLGRVEDLIYILHQERPGFADLNAATTYLASLLADQTLLLVIDDVWNEAHLKPFIQGGSHCVRLITTRDEQVLPPGTKRILVDAMSRSEAIQLLSAGLDKETCSAQDLQTLEHLATDLGEWPLLLKLVNGVLRDRVNTYHQPVADALAYISNALQKRGSTVFDAKNAQERDQAVEKTLSVSFEQLEPDEFARYQELAIFPENVPIPLRVVLRLWSATGKLDALDTEILCQRLHELSLLLHFDVVAGQIQLHDVVQRYLKVRVGIRLPALHRLFLDTYGLTRWAHLPMDELYLWRYLGFHLLAAERGAMLLATVTDLLYLATKAYVSGASSVEADLKLSVQQAQENHLLQQLSRHLMQMSHLLNRARTLHETACILLSRLCHLEALASLCSSFEGEIARPFLSAWHTLPDLFSSALILTLTGHTGVVTGCAVSPSGQWIVSSSNDQTLKIWDRQTGMEVRTLHGHTSEVTCCAVSPCGEWIVSGALDGTLKIWDAHNGEERFSIKSHTNLVTGCTVNPRGEWIVSSSNDKALKICELHTGLERFTLRGHTREVTGCAISPSGQWIVSSSNDQTLKIWELHTGLELRTLHGHNNWVTGCAISPSGQWIVSVSDEQLKVWDVQSGKEQLSVQGPIGWLTSCKVEPSGTWIVSASANGALKLWDSQTGQERLTLQGHTERVTGCAISPSGQWLVSSSNDQTLKIWDAYAKPERVTPRGYMFWLNHGAVDPSGQWLVSSSNDQTLKIWDAQTGTERLTLQGHTGAVRGCAVDPSGQWLVSAANDKTLKIWDAQMGTERLTLQGHTNWVNACAVDPSGQWIISAANDKTLKIWDAQMGTERLTLRGHQREVRDCALSPSGEWIVSASWDRTLKIWDTQTGADRLTLCGHTDWVNGCAVSPSGEWIVSASADNTLKIWDTQTGADRLTLRGHTDWVNGCAVSPSGEWIASASTDSTIKLWDARTGTCLSTLHVDGILFHCTFVGSRARLIAVGEGGLYFLRIIL